MIFGDSYFEVNTFANIPERLSDAYSVSFVRSRRPFAYLDQAKTLKHIIIELSERSFYIMFDQGIMNQNHQNTMIPFHRKAKNLLFPRKLENRYDLMLRRSYLTNLAYNKIQTLKFDWFGIHHDEVHISDDESTLFLSYYLEGERLENIFRPIDHHFDTAYQYLKRFEQLVVQTYQIKPIFIIVPNKGTISYTSDHKRYNQLIPTLQKYMSNDSIRFIDVYHAFKSAESPVYYKTDTHWNENGLTITYDLLMRELLKDVKL
jgi:hypothetical protein